MITCFAGPDVLKHKKARLSWQIQVQYDEVGTTGVAGIEALNKLSRALAVGDKDQLASNGVFLKGFADQEDVGRVILD